MKEQSINNYCMHLKRNVKDLSISTKPLKGILSNTSIKYTILMEMLSDLSQSHKIKGKIHKCC